jgi:hypothetical protein
MNEQPSLTERVQAMERDHPITRGHETIYAPQILELPEKNQPLHQEPAMPTIHSYFYRAGYSLRNALYVLSQIKF